MMDVPQKIVHRLGGPLEMGQEKCGRLRGVDPRRDVGDVAPVALAQAERLETGPDVSGFQLIAKRHAGDVDQVRIVGRCGLAERQQRPDVR